MTPETTFSAPQELIIKAQEFSACLLSGLVRFGAYPDEARIRVLEELGYGDLIDLTSTGECTPYARSEHTTVRREPMEDRRVPSVEALSGAVAWALSLVRKGTLVYVHCRGGHGRAALFAACLLVSYAYSGVRCTWADLTDPADVAIEALDMVRAAHQGRTVMDRKWRKMGAPQTSAQRDFVHVYAHACARKARTLLPPAPAGTHDGTAASIKV
jgi:hypothetical protein